MSRGIDWGFIQTEDTNIKEGQYVYIKDGNGNVVCYATVHKVLPHEDNEGKFDIIIGSPAPLTEIG